ncbi:type II toxin-antitoxin system RelE/ParE family toxin [Xenorhabdus sp. PR6a]|uniref:type II toxin-antitoxin system RelE/ParE family toxin n=1 Tax=Xenorhabdus sp. PR6a TaxID=3025877 RepID=UPI002359FD0E|nr:type II toxin-antitoxin system RelE/ParE family toxin [Xenorhabdus sp. PR6a]MDC9583214.1 type II toxin-antitoxin system RelE/ParE family toxin [Xenorhabdus sp. PR6a]
MRLEWKPMALEDREKIMNYIARDNPQAAIKLDDAFEAAAERAKDNPDRYKSGRLKNTQEIVVHPHYILVYKAYGETVTILRVLHTSQQWP